MADNCRGQRISQGQLALRTLLPHCLTATHHPAQAGMDRKATLTGNHRGWALCQALPRIELHAEAVDRAVCLSTINVAASPNARVLHELHKVPAAHELVPCEQHR